MKNKIFLLMAVTTLGLTTATIAQVPSYVPTNGLVGYWPFNGNANDESGNGNNGTVNGATLTQDRFGNLGKAYSFNANYLGHYSGADYIRCLNPGPLGSTSRTFSFWVKTDSASISLLNNTVLSYGKNEVGGLAQQFRIVVGGGGCNSGGILVHNLSGSKESQYTPLNSWDFFSVVYDSFLGQNFTGVKIYLNANLLTNYCTDNAGSIMNTGNQNPITIGRYHDLNWTTDEGWFKGILDDIGIWNRALTQQEITDIYNGCQLAVNTQPANQAININNNAQFVVGSSDTNATYQWQTDLGLGFQNISNAGQYNGATNDTLSVSNVTMSNDNQPFRCIINNGSCADTSNVAVLTINNNVGINITAQHNLFSVFPNPAHNIISVKADHKLIGSAFTIYDNTGNAVQSGKINAADTTIELSNLSGGVYLFSVGEKIKQTFKIIKE